MIAIIILLVLFNDIHSKLTPITNNNYKNSEKIENVLKTFLKSTRGNVLVSDGENDLPTSLVSFSTTSINLDSLLRSLDLIPKCFIIFNLPLSSLHYMLTNHTELLPRGATYVIITRNYSMLEDIAELFWKSRMPHILMLAYNESSSKVFKARIKQCGKKVEALFLSDAPNVQYSLLSLDKWNAKTQFKGCPLYATWTLMPPFVNSVNTSMDGIFIELLKVFGQMSNRSIIFRPFDPNYGEEISQSYTFESVLNDLDGEFSQIFLGPANTHTVAIFDLSPIITDNSMLFLCPKPLAVFWHKILSKSMAVSIIAYSLLVLIMATTFSYLAKASMERLTYFSIGQTFFVFFGMVLDMPSLNNRFPKKSHLRIFLGMMLIHVMVVSMFIQGSVVSNLSASIFGKPIESMEELLDSNLPIKALNGLTYLFQFSESSSDKEMYKRMTTLEGIKYLFDAGNLAVAKKNFATIVDTGYLIMRPNILKSFSAVEVYSMKQAIAMPKGAYFSNQYIAWFTRLVEIGIVTKYVKLYRNYYAIGNSIEEEKRKFMVTFEQFFPVVEFIGALYLFSTIVFVAEVFYDKIKHNFCKQIV